LFFNLTLFLTASLLMVACDGVSERFRLPQAAVVIVVGVLLGPAGFSLIRIGEAEHVLSELAVILILFSAGYDIQWSHFAAAIKPGILVGLAGIILSLLSGFAAAYIVSQDIDEALYVGIALSATSIGLSVALMHHAAVLESKVGQILLAAAIVDDILVLYLLSATHAGLSSDNGLGLILFSLLMSLLVLSGLSVLLWLLNTLLVRSSLRRLTLLRRVFAVLTALLAAWVTASFELSPVVGGFAAGAVAAVFKTRFAQSTKAAKTTDSEFFASVSRFFSPLFFLAIGMQITELALADDELIGYVLLVIAAAVIGKLLAPWVMGSFLSLRERWLLGFALLPRAEVALVVASVGLQQGHLSHHAMIALVLMTLATALIASSVIPVLANHLDPRSENGQ
jgi:Kef-type K+ transport system membrane component KefB